MKPKQILWNTIRPYFTESHFIGNPTPPELPGIVTTFGTGSSAGILTPAQVGRPGILRLTASAVDGRSLWRMPSSLLLASSNLVVEVEVDFRVPVLSNNVDGFSVLIGFGGTYLASTDEHTNAAYLYQDSGAYYPTTKVTGQTAVYQQFIQAANTGWNNLKIICSGSTATFDLNGETIAQGGMPQDAIALLFHIFKFPGQTGTAARFLDIDYASLLIT